MMKERFLQTLFIRFANERESTTTYKHPYSFIPCFITVDENDLMNLRLFELKHYRMDEKTIPFSDFLIIERRKAVRKSNRSNDFKEMLNLFVDKYTDMTGKDYTMAAAEKIYMEGIMTAMTMDEYKFSHALFFGIRNGDTISPLVIGKKYRSVEDYFKDKRPHEKNFCVFGNVSEFIENSKHYFSEEACLISNGIKDLYFAGHLGYGPPIYQQALSALRFRNEDEALDYLNIHQELFNHTGYEIVPILWKTYVY